MVAKASKATVTCKQFCKIHFGQCKCYLTFKILFSTTNYYFFNQCQTFFNPSLVTLRCDKHL